jgi:peroxiredoxin
MASILQPNAPAPDFSLPDGTKKQVKLSDFKGKNVVLAFYPADWSPVCTSELAIIQETIEDIRAYNAEILAVSVDNVWSHKAWAQQQNLTFPLLSDFWPHGEVARKYGIFLEKDGISNRALFFIDGSGNLRSSWIAENPGVAPGINLIFDALEEIKGGRQQEARRG